MIQMKTSLRRFFSFLTALALLFALSSAAFADGGDYEDDDDRDTGSSDWYDDVDPGVFVSINVGELTLRAGDSTTVAAKVTGADSGARFEWKSSDTSIVSIRTGVDSNGKVLKPDTVSVTALKTGRARITLTVTCDAANYDYDFFDVIVKNAVTPVSLSGGGSISMGAGDSQSVIADVSGGSGSYTYSWDAYGSAALSFTDKLNNQALIYAGRAGTGTVLLTVYDAVDPSNNATVTWSFTVTEKPQLTPPEIGLSRGSIDLGAGATAQLSASVSGGSGSFDYYWSSDNPALVSVYGNGRTAEIRASGTPLPGANSALISLTVYDWNTGLSSAPASCTVTVSGGSETYNTRKNLKAGESVSLSTIAEEISADYSFVFGSALNLSANVKFENPVGSIGAIQLQDDAAVRSGVNYSFASFQDMLFSAAAPGQFSVNYIITDGGNTISGKIDFIVESNGIPVESATISMPTLRLAVNSSYRLSVAVNPSNAEYTVSWYSDRTDLATVTGSGTQATVYAGPRTGTARVVATVSDPFGNSFALVCNVTIISVEPEYDPDYYFSTSLTVVLGSDYYGTSLSESMKNKFKSAFGRFPDENATIVFDSLGNNRFGELHLLDGKAPVTKRNYTLRDWVDMYFTPYAKGVYSIDYHMTYQGDTMRGTLKINVETSSLTVTLNQTALQMSPYSSQNITVDIAPRSANYKLRWISSDSSVAAVTGSNAAAVINSYGSGTATVTAVVTDNLGVEIRRSCIVVVSSSGNVFNPSVATTLGIPYTGTGTSGAMRSQFAAVYGTELKDTATIRFGSTGNNEVGVLRLADGSMARPDVDYTFAQYVAMYTQPVTSGVFSFPYTLKCNGQTLFGTVSVIIGSASISTNLPLRSNAAYTFSDIAGGGSGAQVLSDSIRNAVGANWSYLRFVNVSSDSGTLYLNRNSAPITATTNVTPDALQLLYFVPGTLNGTFTAAYTVYTATGAVLAVGTLNITRPSSSFNDVSAAAYYAKAVDWAVGRGITSGTGGGNFSPNMTVTRAQAVTFLWRAAGQPKHTLAVNPFTDVIAGSYYYDAVLWAVQQGITNGTSDTRFSPDRELRRDQLLTFLCRANGGYAGGADWSQLAVDWANSCGLLSGVPDAFVADSLCPRCDVVYYLWKNYNG